MTNAIAALLLANLLSAGPQTSPCYDAHVFYYGWYGNPATDGHWSHWDHAVDTRGGDPVTLTPPDRIGSDFYPKMGLYSSNDPAAVAGHMRSLQKARVGVVSFSWWGKDDPSDKTLGMVMDIAARFDLKVNFHIEPFPGRTAATTRDAMVYLIDRFKDHPALYRHDGRPMFYIYDSYLVSPDEWADVLTPAGATSIRRTAHDAVVIGLYVKKEDNRALEEAGFDGCYTYFATDGFTYGSTMANWPAIAAWAREKGKIFIPSVGPGYIDIRIRPWNGVNTRGREDGAYYDREWEAALAVNPAIVSVTSFNEWHEGTQIEPAVPKTTEGFEYLDYTPKAPEWYLDRTRHWIERLVEQPKPSASATP